MRDSIIWYVSVSPLSSTSLALSSSPIFHPPAPSSIFPSPSWLWQRATFKADVLEGFGSLGLSAAALPLTSVGALPYAASDSFLVAFSSHYETLGTYESLPWHSGSRGGTLSDATALLRQSIVPYSLRNPSNTTISDLSRPSVSRPIYARLYPTIINPSSCSLFCSVVVVNVSFYLRYTLYHFSFNAKEEKFLLFVYFPHMWF